MEGMHWACYVYTHTSVHTQKRSMYMHGGYVQEGNNWALNIVKINQVVDDYLTMLTYIGTVMLHTMLTDFANVNLRVYICCLKFWSTLIVFMYMYIECSINMWTPPYNEYLKEWQWKSSLQLVPYLIILLEIFSTYSVYTCSTQVYGFWN